MKSDKPFRKGLICGSVLFVFAIIFLRLLVSIENQESHYVKYGRVFIASFVPTMLVSIWAFFSKKRWTWIRFIIVTMLSCFLCFVSFAYYLSSSDRSGWPVPKLAFSTQIPAAWIVEMGDPITDKNGEPLGSQLRLTNKDRQRTIWIEAWNSQDSFESNVESSKQLTEARDSKLGFQIKEDRFSYEVTGGNKIALLNLRTQKGDVTHNIICRCWTQELEHEQIVLCSIAMGENIEISEDKEIGFIISSVIIK